MNVDMLMELAHDYREILRQSVYLTRALDSDGELSTAQVSTLNMVSTEPQRVSVIARNAGIRVPSATEQVIKLEAAGLVRRIADDSDARVVLVELTDAGRAAVDRSNAVRNRRMADALRTLDEAERATITAALPALAKLNGALSP
ncbi:MarR family winged helix-turn-helix transcriptional regulator [Specibacter cremeus]|uniref:MarR family winged helix-turn-helix transcriptional regulator n=1 Tax=Specibacter cremeus TaxID=1629051 RepID=UPI000F796545|nr:MarR family transcriptional regulator [Specibacter cremeus]